MRLLELVDGELQLTKDLVRDIPDYAILSHTWGADEDEVTYRDMVRGDALHKPGYAKIRFCAEQARRDGLRYCWVDSCCIDKSSSSELSEAITSMFRWYQRAVRCYVYLSDFVVTHSEGSPSASWEAAFRAHRWFTRGWTLQELLAPTSVEFFASDGQRIGDKLALEELICEITGIPAAALQGADLSTFGIEQRFEWTETRRTTREEDEAYCLLGLFGVSMLPMYGEGKSNAVRRLRAEMAIVAMPDHQLPPPPQASPFVPFKVPFEQNSSFTGREEELEKIHQMLSPEKGQMRTVAISGLGGVGKTQIALELVYQIKAKDVTRKIFWIPATSLESINQGFLEIARTLGIVDSESQEQETDVKKLVQHHLSGDTARRWTLLFDNADDMSIWIEKKENASERLIDILPRSRYGSIIFTTRDRQAASRFAGPNVLEVFEMNNTGGLALLRNSLIRKDMAAGEEASMLLDRLTYLPLAIVQAAAYINAKGVSLGEYIALLNAQEEDTVALLSEDFEAEGRYADTKNPVAVTWLMSFQLMRERNPLAADILSFIACVDAKDIPRKLLPLTESQKENTDALGALQAYSFIATKTANTRITIHRLVHIALRNWLRREGLLLEWTRRAVGALITALDVGDQDKLSVLRPFMPHAYYVLEKSILEDTDEQLLRLEMVFSDCLFLEGRYAELERRLLTLLERNRLVFGGLHQDTLETMSKLALMYMSRQDFDSAAKMQEQVTAVRKNQRVRPFKESIRDATQLSIMYRLQGRLTEAQQLLVELLEFAKKSPDYSFYSTIVILGMLADVYTKQGEERKARKLLEREFRRRHRAQLDTDDQEIIRDAYILVNAYRRLSLFQEAEGLCLEALECQRKQSGGGSLLTADGNTWLARIYTDQERFDEAEGLCMQSLAAYETKLGPEHPSSADQKIHLAHCWWEMGRRADAIRILEEVVQVNTRMRRDKRANSKWAAETLEEYREEVQKTGHTAPSIPEKEGEKEKNGLTRRRLEQFVSKIRDRF